jgi:hypothetical protein
MRPQKQGSLESAAAAAAVMWLTAGAGYACGLTMEKLQLDAAAAAGVRYAPLGAADMASLACWPALLHLMLLLAADPVAAAGQLIQRRSCCAPAATGVLHWAGPHPWLLLLLALAWQPGRSSGLAAALRLMPLAS